MQSTPAADAAAASGATRTPETATLSDAVTGLAAVERVRAFDLARGLAIVFMIGVHVLWHWGAPDTWLSPVGQVISFLGGPTAAPVFMFLMGASLAFSSRSSFRSLAVRGLWLLWLGYLLNALRGAIPAYLGLSAGIVTPEQIAPFTIPWLLTTVDVHHMAGLSLIALAALRMATKPGWLWLVLAAGVVLAGPFLRGLEFGTPFLDGPLTPVLGGAPNVYYAVVPWIAFPLAGAVFGALVARVPERGRVFRAAALVGVALCAVGAGLFLVQPPSFDVNTYWRMPPSYFVAITGLVLVWLWVCDLVVRHVRANRAFAFLYDWSGNVIAIYFTHWLVVGWGVGVFGFRSQPLEGALLGIVVAIVATALLSRFAIGLETPRWLERLGGQAAARTPAAIPAVSPAPASGAGARGGRLSRPAYNPAVPIYLDHAATNPMRPEALEAMLPYLGAEFGNPSSPHAYGRRARAALDEAHERIAGQINAGPREIILTSGGTEALNLALKGAAWAGKARGHRIVTSAVEHHAVLHALQHLEKYGFEIIELPVDRYGRVDPEQVAAAINERTILVSIQLANNEVGTLQPIAAIAQVVREKGAKGSLFAVDAVAAAAWLPIDVEALDVDLLAIAGHKVEGPKGVGALYLRKGTHILSQQQGGTQERFRRAGTEDVAAAVGMGVAFELAVAERPETAKRVKRLRDRLRAAILAEEGVELTGHPRDRLPNLLSVVVGDADGAAIVMKLDLEDVAASVGSACTTGSTEPSHVLTAMGYPDEEARGSLRLSLGRTTTDAEIDDAVEILPRVIADTRAAAAVLNADPLGQAVAT